MFGIAADHANGFTVLPARTYQASKKRHWRDRVSLCGCGQPDPFGDAAPFEPCLLSNLADVYPGLVEGLDVVKCGRPGTPMCLLTRCRCADMLIACDKK
jgi:hypothetical protein